MTNGKHCYECFKYDNEEEFCSHKHEHNTCKKCCEKERNTNQVISKISGLWVI